MILSSMLTGFNADDENICICKTNFFPNFEILYVSHHFLPRNSANNKHVWTGLTRELYILKYVLIWKTLLIL
jgi:hypothetical protein